MQHKRTKQEGMWKRNTEKRGEHLISFRMEVGAGGAAADCPEPQWKPEALERCPHHAAGDPQQPPPRLRAQGKCPSKNED